MNRLLWNDKNGTFYDYNFIEEKQQAFDSISNLYPLWANLYTKEQARRVVEEVLPKFICKGGLVSTLEIDTTTVDKNVPQRQWDYPYAWAPHQMLIWEGLLNYGYNELAQQVMYRWLWLFVKTVVNYNGLIPEKFDVKNCTHKVNVEYGNVGTTFKYVPDGGFGWTNASYKLGISLLESKYKKHLNKLTDPDVLFLK